ncbi:MAG: DUF2510 domain-containing protein [Candidatus Nanopelagicales bacterium]
MTVGTGGSPPGPAHGAGPLPGLDGTAPPVGAWGHDPTGRHEFRWWDGRRWTDAVADAGRTSTEPLAGLAVPPEHGVGLDSSRLVLVDAGSGAPAPLRDGAGGHVGWVLPPAPTAPATLTVVDDWNRPAVTATWSPVGYQVGFDRRTVGLVGLRGPTPVSRYRLEIVVGGRVRAVLDATTEDLDAGTARLVGPGGHPMAALVLGLTLEGASYLGIERQVRLPQPLDACVLALAPVLAAELRARHAFRGGPAGWYAGT